MASSTDRIEKTILLRAPRARVWRALTDAREFGAWFKVKLDTGFEPGKRVTGSVAEPGYEHLTMELTVVDMEPERYFSFRWRPFAIDPKVDYSQEPTTLVAFTLEETPEGTRLDVTESGFDGIPAWRRDEAFRMNDKGWAIQVERVKAYVDG